MHSEYLIAIDDFCTHHNIEISFISSLQQTGLIELITVNESKFIDVNQLEQLEKIVRFYFELDINLEGIETITHMLKRINDLQEEVISLRNRLRLYEPND
jgi:hypothetical protein